MREAGFHAEIVADGQGGGGQHRAPPPYGSQYGSPAPNFSPQQNYSSYPPQPDYNSQGYGAPPPPPVQQLQSQGYGFQQDQHNMYQPPPQHNTYQQPPVSCCESLQHAYIDQRVILTSDWLQMDQGYGRSPQAGATIGWFDALMSVGCAGWQQQSTQQISLKAPTDREVVLYKLIPANMVPWLLLPFSSAFSCSCAGG